MTPTPAPIRDFGSPSASSPSALGTASFARHLFIPNETGDRDAFKPEFVVVDACDFLAVPERDGTRSETFIIVDFSRRLVLIGGTTYGGEIKKSVFTVMNYLLPLRGAMPMHCSANIGKDGDTAIFFGLSGTGKTTLSADPERMLIGDDEHGWTDDGIFNFEGGCYAKAINLSAELEPQIYPTTRMFASVLENVVMDERTRELDLDDASLTENTRVAYPLTSVPNTVPSGRGGHPKNLVMLTCDAFGVLPPIARMIARAGDVSLLVGLHRQGRRHGKRRHRTADHVLALLRRAVHGASPGRLREAARRAACAPRRPLLAHQHRMERRAHTASERG